LENFRKIVKVFILFDVFYTQPKIEILGYDGTPSMRRQRGKTPNRCDGTRTPIHPSSLSKASQLGLENGHNLSY